jgi:hypothetical protein
MGHEAVRGAEWVPSRGFDAALAAPEAKSSAAEAIIANFAPTGAEPQGGVHSTVFSVEKIYSPPVFSSGRHPR